MDGIVSISMIIKLRLQHSMYNVNAIIIVKNTIMVTVLCIEYQW